MPTKTWVVGEEVLAADFNAMVQQQVVATFANAAARTSALTTPQNGQLTYLQDVKRYESYNGAAWIKLLPVVGGYASIVTDANGYFVITFPTPLTYTPTFAVLQVKGNDTLAQVCNPLVVDLNTTTLSGIVFDQRNPTNIIGSNPFNMYYMVGTM